MAIPRVSVLMSVYNGELYIKESIESILNQTYKDFEFIIIDDRSSDKSVEIIQSYNDHRIHLIRNEKNISSSGCLNKGLEIAKGEYLVIMDQDDISLPNRISVQVNFMDNNIKVGVCGSWYKIMGTDKILKLPEDNQSIKVGMFLSNVIAHPTVVLRRIFFKEFSLIYNPSIDSNDYDLWSRSQICFEFANIPKALLLYRVHPNQITHRNKERLQRSGYSIALRQLKYLELDPDKLESSIHVSILSGETLPELKLLKQAIDWLVKLETANKKVKFYNEELFFQMLEKLKNQTLYNFYFQEKYNLNLLKGFFHSSLRVYKLFNFKERIKFTLKCLVYWKPKMKNL